MYDRRSPRRLAALFALALSAVAFALLTPHPVACDDEKPGQPPAAPGTFSDVSTISFINQQIEQQWKENSLKPSAVATDYEFIRRVFLDLIGRVPTALGEPTADAKTDPIGRQGELAYFLARPARTKRAEVVSYLLRHPDFAKHWANIWTVWLLTRTSPPGIDRDNLHSWLADRFAENKRYDDMVTDLLTATGKCDDRSSKNAAATNFILSHVGEMVPGDRRRREGQFEMVPITSRVTRLFLGIQTQCTQCHDHPFIDSRKQNQYWGINVFFRQVERVPPTIMVRGREEALRAYELRDNLSANPDAAVYFERRNGLLLKSGAVYLNGVKVIAGSAGEQVNRRQELAKLLTQDEYFAKAIVNRMWQHFFGRGFTNPVDDFGEHNPVSHAELLDRLAKDFVASGYDLRRLMIWLTSSRPYQLTSIANVSNVKSDTDPYFSRMQLKALSPEELVDSILVTTNAQGTKLSAEARRRMHEEWLRDFTVNFGDDEGNEATFNGTVIQALMLMNGPRLNEAVRAKPGSTLARIMEIPNAQERLRLLYLAALSRPPSQAEAGVALRLLNSSSKDPSAPWQDILWALLNSNEFILNH
jgi:hypothetical protein